MFREGTTSLSSNIPSPRDSLNRILSDCLRMLSADRCALYLKDEKNDRFFLTTSIGLSDRYLQAITEKWEDLPIAHLFEEPRFTFFQDAPTDSRLHALKREIELEGFRSAASVPLPSEENPIGVLSLYFDQERNLSEEEIATFRLFADLAAVAIENQNLYVRETEASRRLHKLQEVALQVSSSLELSEVLDAITKACVDLLRGIHSQIFLVDPKSQHLIRRTFHSAFPRSPGGPLKLAPGEGLVGWIAANRSPLILPDMQQDPRTAVRDWVKQNGLRAFTGVPLIASDRLVGVITCLSNIPGNFTETDLHLLRSLAGHAVSAIEKAELFEKSQDESKRLAILNAISQKITSSLELDDVLEAILQAAKQLTLSDTIQIWLKARRGDRYICRASTGIKGKPHDKIVLPRGRGLTGRVIEQGELICVQNLSEDPRWVPMPELWENPEEPRSFLSVPMLSGGRVIGALTCLALQRREWPPNLIEAAAALASHASIAIDNARLFGELRKTGERLDNVVRSAADAIVTVDLEGRVTSWNAAAEKIYGYAEEEVLGKYIHRIFLSGDGEQDGFLLARTRILENGDTSFLLEGLRRRKDGGIIEVSVVFSPVKNNRGELTGLLSISREIGAQKRAAETLKLTQFSVNQARDAIFWIAPDGRYLYVNEAACRLLGYTQSELLTRSVSDINPACPPERWAQFWTHLKRAGSMAFETQTRTKRGNVLPIEISANYLEFGGKEYAFSFVRDLTERKKAELAIQTTEARNRAILAAAPDSIITFNETGTLDSFNPMAEQMFGYAAEDVIGRGVDVLMDRANARKFQAYLRWYLQTGEPLLFALGRETIGRRMDGSLFPMNMAVSEAKFEGHRFFTGIIRDLTHQQSLGAQFFQLQSPDSAESLASGVARDFDNLLTTIQSRLTLAMTHLPPAGPGYQHLVQIGRSVDRALELISKIHTLGRTLPMDAEKFDLLEALQNAIALQRIILPPAIAIETHLTQEPCPVQADPSLLREMFLNLCMNAWDAMPRGGRLIIGLERILLERDHPDLEQGMEPGEYARLSVRDTGAGIREGIRNKIFEPFFTTKESRGGTGLGLPMVQRIVKEHGGFIHLESQTGKGTTFWVYLPLVREEEPEPYGEFDPERAGNGECILVADDDPLALEIVEEILRDNGYEVITARDGFETLKKFRKERDRIALVLMDVVMPHLSGRMAFNQIRKLRPDVKVLFSSGNEVDIPEAVEAGGAAFIEKPYSVSELLQGIRQMLDRS